MGRRAYAIEETKRRCCAHLIDPREALLTSIVEAPIPTPKQPRTTKPKFNILQAMTQVPKTICLKILSSKDQRVRKRRSQYRRRFQPTRRSFLVVMREIVLRSSVGKSWREGRFERRIKAWRACGDLRFSSRAMILLAPAWIISIGAGEGEWNLVIREGMY